MKKILVVIDVQKDFYHPDVPISILKECIVPYNNEEFNEFCKLNNINEYKIWE